MPRRRRSRSRSRRRRRSRRRMNSRLPYDPDYTPVYLDHTITEEEKKLNEEIAAILANQMEHDQDEMLTRIPGTNVYEFRNVNLPIEPPQPPLPPSPPVFGPPGNILLLAANQIDNTDFENKENLAQFENEDFVRRVMENERGEERRLRRRRRRKKTKRSKSRRRKYKLPR